MSRQAIGQLIDRWLNDPEFRKKVRQDPEGAVKMSGVALAADELAAVKKIDWKLSDEELTKRANNLLA